MMFYMKIPVSRITIWGGIACWCWCGYGYRDSRCWICGLVEWRWRWGCSGHLFDNWWNIIMMWGCCVRTYWTAWGTVYGSRVLVRYVRLVFVWSDLSLVIYLGLIPTIWINSIRYSLCSAIRQLNIVLTFRWVIILITRRRFTTIASRLSMAIIVSTFSIIYAPRKWIRWVL